MARGLVRLPPPTENQSVGEPLIGLPPPGANYGRCRHVLPFTIALMLVVLTPNVPARVFIVSPSILSRLISRTSASDKLDESDVPLARRP